MYPQRSWNVDRSRPQPVYYPETNFFNSRAPNVARFWTRPNEQSHQQQRFFGSQYPLRSLLGVLPVNHQQVPISPYSVYYPAQFRRAAVDVIQGRYSVSGSSGVLRQQFDQRSSVGNISSRNLGHRGRSFLHSIVGLCTFIIVPHSCKVDNKNVIQVCDRYIFISSVGIVLQ